MDKKILFLLYDERSGSTLISALLNQYKGISVSQESEFVSRIIEFSDEITIGNFDKLISFLRCEPQFEDLDLNMQNVKRKITDAKGAVTKKRLIEIIVNEYFSNRDAKAEYLIIKHAPYIYLDEIREMFPSVSILHIVRDVRGVYNSKKRNYSLDGSVMDKNPFHASWNWVQKLKIVSNHEDITFTVRYEDLVEKTDDVMNSVLNSMSVRESLRKKEKSKLEYYKGIGSQQKRLHKNLTKEPDPEFSYKWEKQLSISEITMINFWCKKYLLKYGYKVKDSNKIIILVHTSYYLFKFTSNKAINILTLLKDPSKLKLKFKRKFKMLKG